MCSEVFGYGESIGRIHFLLAHFLLGVRKNIFNLRQFFEKMNITISLLIPENLTKQVCLTKYLKLWPPEQILGGGGYFSRISKSQDFFQVSRFIPPPPTFLYIWDGCPLTSTLVCGREGDVKELSPNFSTHNIYSVYFPSHER